MSEKGFTPIEGTAEECFAHYLKTLPLPGTRHVNKDRLPLKDFTKVGERTVERWVLGPQVAKGVELLRIRFFLEANGYRVSELDELKSRQPLVYKLAEMIAYDVFSVEKAQADLGFKYPQELYRLSLRGGSTTHAREDMIAALYDKNRDQLIAEREKWQARLKKECPSREAKKYVSDRLVPALPEYATTSRDNGKTGGRAEIGSLARLIASALPLAEYLASGECTQEDRIELRRLVGGDGVFRLSNALNKLCGEKAREAILSNKA